MAYMLIISFRTHHRFKDILMVKTFVQMCDTFCLIFIPVDKSTLNCLYTKFQIYVFGFSTFNIKFKFSKQEIRFNLMLFLSIDFNQKIIKQLVSVGEYYNGELFSTLIWLKVLQDYYNISNYHS